MKRISLRYASVSTKTSPRTEWRGYLELNRELESEYQAGSQREPQTKERYRLLIDATQPWLADVIKSMSNLFPCRYSIWSSSRTCAKGIDLRGFGLEETVGIRASIMLELLCMSWGFGWGGMGDIEVGGQEIGP